MWVGVYYNTRQDKIMNRNKSDWCFEGDYETTTEDNLSVSSLQNVEVLNRSN